MTVFRVEHTKDFTVMSNHHLKNIELSLKAKGLLSLMLSLPDDWDYTMAGLATICKDGISSITSTITELEAQGYVIRGERTRNEKGQLGKREYVVLEHPKNAENQVETLKESTSELTVVESPTPALPTYDLPTLENPMLDNPMYEKRMQLNTNISSTKELNTKELRTKLLNKHQSIHPSNQSLPAKTFDPGMGMDVIDGYEHRIKENVSYEFLIQRFEKARVDEIVTIMVEVLCSVQPTMKIGSDELLIDWVKKKVLSLNASHVEYMFNCLDKTTTQIKNMKAYLLATIFNAPSSMDNHYQAHVNYAMSGKRG